MTMYILYKTINLVNNKYYIGIHRTTNIDDGYLGSGTILKIAIKKYGKDNFKRITLAKASSYDELVLLEREIVNEEFLKKPDTYNMELGGSGGKVWSKEMRDNMSTSLKNSFKAGRVTWNKGKKTGNVCTDEHRKKLSIKMSGDGNPMYGKNVKDYMTPSNYEKMKQNISKGNTGKKRTDEHKKNYSKSASQRKWLVHRSGKITHTQNPTDDRFNHPDWQHGKKWKINKNKP